MRTNVRFPSVCLFTASLLGWFAGCSSIPAQAQEAGKAKCLFNGKDLTGWVTPDDKAIFSV